MMLQSTLFITQTSFMWLAAVHRCPLGGSYCCAPDVGPHCVSLSFRGAGRGEPSRRGHWGARSRRVPLPCPQGRHRQGPCLEHCGDISQMLLPRARSPARQQWPTSRLSFSKGGLPRWVTPPPTCRMLLLPHPLLTQLISKCKHLVCALNTKRFCLSLWVSLNLKFKSQRTLILILTKQIIPVTDRMSLWILI